MARAFDSFNNDHWFDDFVKCELPEGHIVVAACKDECISNMSSEGKKWFEKMGSKEMNNVKYR